MDLVKTESLRANEEFLQSVDHINVGDDFNEVSGATYSLLSQYRQKESAQSWKFDWWESVFFVQRPSGASQKASSNVYMSVQLSPNNPTWKSQTAVFHIRSPSYVRPKSSEWFNTDIDCPHNNRERGTFRKEHPSAYPGVIECNTNTKRWNII